MLVNNNRIISSMLITIFGLALIALFYIVYTFYYKPKITCQRYVKLLQSLGCQVLYIPVQIFRAPFFQKYRKNERERKDAFYDFKNGHQGYDAIVSSLVQHPHITFLNWKIAKEFLTPQKIIQLPKIDLGLSIVKHFIGHALLMSQGSHWKSKRKVFSKVFSYDFIYSQIPMIAKICDSTFDQIENRYRQEHPECSDNQMEIKMSTFGSKIFGSIILACFLGVQSMNDKIEDNEISEFIVKQSDLTTQISKDPLILLFGVKYFQLGLVKAHRELKRRHLLLRALTAKYLQTIRERFSLKTLQQKKETSNIIESLLYLRDVENQVDFDDVELTEEIMGFSSAAIDTSTYFFIMMIFYVFEHPEIEAKIRQEVGKFFKQDKDINTENLKKAQYIDCVQYEVLRMFGPTAGIFFRKPIQDVYLGNIPIEKGILVNFNSKACLFDPELFPNPQQFRPQRWDINTEGNSVSSLNILLMLGFSGGPRNCLGKQLAFLQSKITLIKFMKRYSSVTESKDRIIGYNLMTYLPNTLAKIRKI